jgi:ADP-heptose:LPS heptosyltransferase
LDETTDLTTLPHNRVCILTEQGGYGDNIMSVRCLAEMSDRYVFILICPDQLAALFKTYPWLECVIPTKDLELHSTKQVIDKCCGWYRLLNERFMHEKTYNPLIELNLSHRRANAASYFYHTDNDSRNWLTTFLQERRALKYNSGALIVAIIWMSGAMCDNRYLDLSNFKSIFECHNLRFISLQKGHNHEQLIYASDYYSKFMQCQNLISSCSDFADTALAAAYCDHVVTVDTSVAHVCGFLGVRTHILCSRDKYKAEQWEEGKYWNDTYLREIHSSNVTVYDFDHTSSESLEKAINRISVELR